MNPEVIFLANVLVTGVAFGWWKDSIAAGVFMVSTILGVSMFVTFLIGVR